MTVGEKNYTTLVILTSCLSLLVLFFILWPWFLWTIDSEGAFGSKEYAASLKLYLSVLEAFIFSASPILLLTSFYNMWKSRLVMWSTKIQVFLLFFLFPLGTAVSFYGFYLLNDAEKRMKQTEPENLK